MKLYLHTLYQLLLRLFYLLHLNIRLVYLLYHILTLKPPTITYGVPMHIQNTKKTKKNSCKNDVCSVYILNFLLYITTFYFHTIITTFSKYHLNIFNSLFIIYIYYTHIINIFKSSKISDLKKRIFVKFFGLCALT